jgi:anti-sigma regulatory factor (Ser/Thr protein kinase)
VLEKTPGEEFELESVRAFADALPLLVWTVGTDDRLTFVNRAWLEYTGIEAGTTIEARNALVHPDDLPRLMGALGHHAPEVEFRLRRLSDGMYRWHLLRWQHFDAGTDDESGMIRVGTALDVHDAHVAREERERLSEVSRVLGTTLDLEQTLERIVSLGIPVFGDACTAKLYEEEDHASDEVARILDEQTLVVPLTTGSRAVGTLRYTRAQGEYDASILPFAEEFGRRAALAIRNARLYEREHRVADALQSASLPRKLPQIPGLAMSAIYVPGQSEAQIGGDWYDAFRLADGRVVISIGDVAGSGLDAAVTMSSVRQLIRGTAQVYADPVMMLDAADRALRIEEPNRFVTAFVAVIDPIDESMDYASAGHPPPFIRRSGGTIEELGCIDLPLGLRAGGRVDSGSVQLHAGDMLVFYTDGLVESTHNLEQGRWALQRALRDAQIAFDSHPAAALYERLLPEGPRDDVAILTLRVGDAATALRRWRYERLDADVLQKLRHEFRAVLVGRMAEDELIAAELVLGELIGNAVRHAPGNVEVVIDLHDEGAPVLHLLDEGPGLELATNLPADPFSENGRGLYIVSELSRAFGVSRRTPHGTHARAVLKT